jgi:hypothetical protein
MKLAPEFPFAHRLDTVDGRVRGHEGRSSRPQAIVAARFHAWYRPGSRRAIRKIMASGRNGVVLRGSALAGRLHERPPGLPAGVARA